MKFFAALAVALLLVLPVRAQENPDDQYVIIYTLIQQGDANLDSGQPQKALDSYREAQTELQKFQQVYADWNPNIVSFRLSYLAQKIAALTPQTPPASAPVAAAKIPVVPVPVNASPGVDSLNAQIRQLQADNETLQAKLKEALSVQPAMVSTDAFAQLQKQADDLAKENDLLKATVAQQSTNESPQLRQALTQQTTLATQLAQQNQSLQSRIVVLTTEASAAEALREENTLLKKEVAGANPALALASTNVQQQIFQLEAENTQDRLETKALENRIKRMEETSVTAEAGGASATELQSQISALTMERDNLKAQLGDANKKAGNSKNLSGSAQLDALAMEVETLRARVAVYEAEAVPYTPQELALFQPGPMTGGPDTSKKSGHKISGGNAVLVAEAQNYYTNREYDKAADDYQKVLQRDANNPVALANLASIEVEQNKIPEADKHIQAAVAQSPNDAFDLTVLGRVKFAQGDYDGSLDALERAAKLDPKNAQVENFLGVALAEKGLRTQAETAFRKAIQIDPDYGDAHKNLTIFYLTARPPMVELARWHYEKALAAGVPPSPDLQRMLDQDRAANSQ